MLTCAAAADFPPINRKQMDVSSPMFWLLDNAADTSNSSDSFATTGPGSWLRIDLGRRYLVGRFVQQPCMYTSEGRINGYEIYVTDSTSDDVADWGPWVGKGEWPNNGDRKPSDFKPTVGRYVILHVVSVHYTYADVTELWAYGEPASFAVASQVTHNASHTNSTTVDVAAFDIVPGQAKHMTGWQLTQSDAQPTEWLPAPPKTFTFKADREGDVTLHGWAKDWATPPRISHCTATITYTKAAPTAKAKNITAPASPGHPAIIRGKDVDDGSFDQSGMGIMLKVSCPQNETPAASAVTLSNPGDYTVTLTAINSAGTSASADCRVKVAPPWPTKARMSWIGGAAGDTGWLTAANWSGGLVPDSPAGVLSFNNAGAGTLDQITSVVNPKSGTWTIAGLNVNYDRRSHRIDLAGNRLVIAGQFRTGDMIHVPPLNIANGTLQIGTPEQPGDLTIGYAFTYYPAGPSAMVILGTPGTGAPKTTLQTFMRSCNVAWSPMWCPTGANVLDLRDAIIADGVFSAATLRVGSRGHGSIKFSERSGLRQIVVADWLEIGCNGLAVGRIGDPSNGWKLPPNVSVKLGTPEKRANLMMATAARWGRQGQDAYLAASSGGRFEAYLEDLRVTYDTVESGQTTGVLDIRAMDECVIDAATIEIGRALPRSAVVGSVHLPKGTLKAGKLAIGCDAAAGAGLLQLNGTTCTADAIYVRPTGLLEINVPAASAGLDLPDNATITVDKGGRIRIASMGTLPKPGLQWCLRWKGDHAAKLQELVRDGKLTWEAGLALSIFSRDGSTLLGLTGEEPRIARFVVTDQLSGGTVVTNSTTVNIDAAVAEGQVITGCAVSQTPTPPDPKAEGAWAKEFPGSFTFTAPPGDVTLYAWIRNDRGAVGGRPATIGHLAPEISKKQMAATASGTAAGSSPQNAIDGSPAAPGWLADAAAGSWLRIDLGGRFRLGWFGYQPRTDNPAGRIKEYEVYVSDSRGPDAGTLAPADARKHWGEPVAKGQWDAASAARVPNIVFSAPKTGRFVILYAVSAEGAAGANELWLALTPAGQ